MINDVTFRLLSLSLLLLRATAARLEDGQHISERVASGDKWPRSYLRRRATANRIAAGEPEHTATGAVVSHFVCFQRQNQITQMYPLAVQFATGGLNSACARTCVLQFRYQSEQLLLSVSPEGPAVQPSE